MLTYVALAWTCHLGLVSCAHRLSPLNACPAVHDMPSGHADQLTVGRIDHSRTVLACVLQTLHDLRYTPVTLYIYTLQRIESTTQKTVHNNIHGR